ncbi:hypothetical protein QE152_g14101 [Popillia japonica]|uniref:Uncharacterized protein n=1 Tax=Popillia japonica TaxID=7064 RepID=A0AAW1L7P3_POPJA
MDKKMTNLATDVDMIMVQKEEKEIYTRQLTGSKSKRSRRMEEICNEVGEWKKSVKWELGMSEGAYQRAGAYKLSDAEVVRQYQQQISTEYWKIKEHIKERDPEQVWMVVKGIILEAARRACGTSKVRKNQKQTAWWTPQIKEDVEDIEEGKTKDNRRY